MIFWFLKGNLNKIQNEIYTQVMFHNCCVEDEELTRSEESHLSADDRQNHAYVEFSTYVKFSCTVKRVSTVKVSRRLAF